MSNARGLHPPEKVDDYRARGWWGEETLDGLFAGQVRARGDASPSSTRPTARRCSARSRAGSPGASSTPRSRPSPPRLLSLGLGRGDVLAVQLANSIELVEAYLAAWRLGVVVSPLPVQLREREVAAMCASADVAAYLSCPFGDRALAGDAATALAEVAPCAPSRLRPRGGDSDVPIGVRVWHPSPATAPSGETVAAYAAATRTTPTTL